MIAINKTSESILWSRLGGLPIMAVENLVKEEETGIGKTTTEVEGLRILIKGYQSFDSDDMYEWRRWVSVDDIPKHKY